MALSDDSIFTSNSITAEIRVFLSRLFIAMRDAERIEIPFIDGNNPKVTCFHETIE
jgi:hypothetical protein